MNRLLVSIALLALPLTLTAAGHGSGAVVVEAYDASIGELPEGVAVSPKGDIYVTLAGTGELRRIDGKTYAGETFAQFDVGAGFLLGMAFDGDELYVALASFVPETSGIWHVDDDGQIERVVELQGFPNDLTFDRDGNMYITESISGSVYKVEAGSTTPTLWVQDPLLVGDVEVSPVPFPIGVNGITYDDGSRSVIVANSQVPAIIEIDDDNGSAGALTVIASGEHLRGADGIALGRSGDVYVVSNFNSTLSRINRQTGAATILADAGDGLVFPSTVAFGQRGRDKKAVFVANFGFGAGPEAPVSVLRIDVGEHSEPYPAGT
jgi:sugar lactone lactonase YvrE